MKKTIIAILLLIITVLLFFELLFPFPTLESLELLGTLNTNVFSIIPVPTPEQLAQIKFEEDRIKLERANIEQQIIIQQHKAAADLARKQAADVAKAAELARQRQAVIKNPQTFFSNRPRVQAHSYNIHIPYRAPIIYTQPTNFQRRHK